MRARLLLMGRGPTVEFAMDFREQVLDARSLRGAAKSSVPSIDDIYMGASCGVCKAAVAALDASDHVVRSGSVARRLMRPLKSKDL
jgi:hypothetical protein